MRFEHTINIDTRPDAVWSVMADLPRWVEWTGTVKSFEWVEGDMLAVGSKARLGVKGGPKSVWSVTAVDEGRGFTWESDTMGVHTVAGHVIAPTATGSGVSLSVDQSGFMATLLKPMLRRVSNRNLKLEAQGPEADVRSPHIRVDGPHRGARLPPGAPAPFLPSADHAGADHIGTEFARGAGAEVRADTR